MVWPQVTTSHANEYINIYTETQTAWNILSVQFVCVGSVNPLFTSTQSI